uniref:Uncharacterized protein n=1 Tax=Romanomermis culicivorax TaxID=13658 RepID=A0A915ICQ4_ROMCU
MLKAAPELAKDPLPLTKMEPALPLTCHKALESNILVIYFYKLILLETDESANGLFQTRLNAWEAEKYGLKFPTWESYKFLLNNDNTKAFKKGYSPNLFL